MMEKYGTSEVYVNKKTGKKKESLINNKPGKNWVRDLEGEEKLAETIIKGKK